MSKEAWETIQDRTMKTVVIWAMDPAFRLAGADFAGHSGRLEALRELAMERARAEGDLTDRRADFARTESELEELAQRVPAVIGGLLADGDPLLEQLAPIHAVRLHSSTARSLRRALLAHGLWTDFNARLAAETPPAPPLTLPYRPKDSEDPPEPRAAADLDVLVVTGVPQAERAREDARRELRRVKATLRAAAAKLDRDNKRWYKAWTRYYTKGTPEGDAARSQVPTERGTRPPAPLEIASAKADADGRVTLRYPARGGRHATTLELLHRREGDADFDHPVPLERPAQTVGPFAPGETVAFRTRVANSVRRNVLSKPKTLTLPPAPEEED